VLDDLQRQHDVELRARLGQRLGRALAVVDGERLSLGMQGGDADVPGGRVDARHPRAQAGHRLAQKPAAAADVEQRQVLQRRARQGIALPVGCGAVADIADAQRIEPMQGRELAGRVPPLRGDAREALDLGRIDGGMCGIGHDRCP
jgi:hypothetical protein